MVKTASALGPVEFLSRMKWEDLNPFWVWAIFFFFFCHNFNCYRSMH